MALSGPVGHFRYLNPGRPAWAGRSGLSGRMPDVWLVPEVLRMACACLKTGHSSRTRINRLLPKMPGSDLHASSTVFQNERRTPSPSVPSVPQRFNTFSVEERAPPIRVVPAGPSARVGHVFDVPVENNRIDLTVIFIVIVGMLRWLMWQW
jgi:hypothetical protein